MLAILIAAAAVAHPPHRDPGLLHRNVEQLTETKEAEQEAALRRMVQLGGSPAEQAEVLARLAGTLRSRALALSIRAQAEDDTDSAAAERDRKTAEVARDEAITRYRERLTKFPKAEGTDEALFFLADALQDSGKDQEAVDAAQKLVTRYPRSLYAPASHVFIGEHLFDSEKLDKALEQYRAAATVPSDDVYPYALYKAAWCRFNQNRFDDAMKLLKRVSDVSEKRGNINSVQLAREARRDYVLAYARIGNTDTARDHFAQLFGKAPGLKMLEQFDKLLFDTGRDPEAAQVARQLLALHKDSAGAALDQTRLLVLAQRGGKRSDLLASARALVATYQRVRARSNPDVEKDENFAEANRLGEETLRNLAVQIHAEARKTDLDDTWNAARALYADYLTLFPDAPDAYELRFFDGELLYARNAKAEAAEQYEAVTKLDLAATRAHQKPGRWLSKAAWSAVLSRSETLPAEQARDSGERSAQRKLTPPEEKLHAACILYLEALPEGQHAVEVAFKAGRLEYVSGQLDEAQAHLAWIAEKHPEHELSEYSANLVLDIQNIRHDWHGLHAWAVKFAKDKKLLSHGTLAQDVSRIEEESAYAIADGMKPDQKKAQALLAFFDAHPHGQLADKALFGAAAALSRANDIDGALAARARIWKEAPHSPLVPRALLASAADLSAVADLGDAAALLEKYVAGFQKQEAARKWRREHPQPKPKKPAPEGPVFEEAKAQGALHDAIVLREARTEYQKALADRTLSLKLWPKAADKDEQLMAEADLEAKLGLLSKAARQYATLAKEMRGKPSLQIVAWRNAARLFAKVRETGNASWSWTEAERLYKSTGPKGREKLTPDALAAAAEAHYALGDESFKRFKEQQIRAPLMATLNRKIGLLQQVKRRTEETVSYRQAAPAVCALGQLGEAQMLLADALAQSPYPPGLTADQRKLYRAALQEKAKPLFDEARDTLESADGRAHELGVVGTCPTRIAQLIEKVEGDTEDRDRLELAPSPLAGIPEMVSADDVDGERAKRVLGEALNAAQSLSPVEAAAKIEAAVQNAPSPEAQFDYAVALDRAGNREEAEKLYREADPDLFPDAPERAVALAVARKDAAAARDDLKKVDAVSPLRAEVALALGDAASAESAARAVLARKPLDVRALCAMARAKLKSGKPALAKLLAARAASADPKDPEPLLVKAEIARAENAPAEELAAAKAAAETDGNSLAAQLELGRALYERGQVDAAVASFQSAAKLDPNSYAAALALGQALDASGDPDAAQQQLKRATALSPRAAEPHYELARIALDEQDDAKRALEEAKLFLSMSGGAPPAGHPIHALLQRCEGTLRERPQASVVQGQ
ncbi:MAG TPA: tetratricopeptide repeat protein [Myxococcales bacterium]